MPLSLRSALGLALSAFLVCGVVAVGTAGPPGPPPPPPPKVTLRVLAGSELDNLIGDPSLLTADPAAVVRARSSADFRAKMTADTGVTLDVRFAGSLAGAEMLAARPGAYDLAWFASDAYLLAIDPSAVQERHPIMQSPVVLGVKTSVAQRYRWTGATGPSWRDLAQRATTADPSLQRGFTFAMTDPGTSNTGLAALVAASSAFTGRTSPSAAELDAATGLTNLFSGNGSLPGGVGRTASSSGWLTQEYLRVQALPEGNGLDGLVNYESELRGLIQSPPAGMEPMTLIYPSDGVVVSDYPLMLLRGGAPGGNDAILAAYQRLADWLRGSWAQDWIVGRTQRRPLPPLPGAANSAPGEVPGGAFPRLTHALAIPTDREQLNRLILSYHNRHRKPPTTVYVVDHSGSMAEKINDQPKIDRLSAVFRYMAADKPAPTSFQPFQQFRDREDITVIPFDNAVPGQIRDNGALASQRPAIHETISTVPGSPSRERLSDAFDNSMRHPAGNTALYDALYEAYWRLDQIIGKVGKESAYAEGHYPTIVLLTDGERTDGMTVDQFAERWKRLSPDVRSVPTFAIHFGPEPVADRCSGAQPAGQDQATELCRITALTHGKVFDTSREDLLDVLRDIRGYQ